MGDMADWVIDNGLDAIATGDADDEEYMRQEYARQRRNAKARQRRAEQRKEVKT